MNIKTPHSINIEPVLNGFVVQFGCQRIVFTNAKDLCGKIGEYYADPAAVVRDMLASRVNDTLTPARITSLLNPDDERRVEGEGIINSTPSGRPSHGILRCTASEADC